MIDTLVTGWPVLWVVAKTTLLLALALTLVWSARRASASFRHLIIVMGMIGCLVVPALSFVVPPWKAVPRVGVLERIAPLAATETSNPDAQRADAAPSRAGIHEPTPSPTPAPSPSPTPFVAPPAVSNEPPAPLESGAASDPAGAVAGPAWRTPSWLGTVAGVWLLGVVLLLGSIVWGVWAANRMIRLASPLEDPSWLRLLTRCRERLGIREHVGLRTGPRGSMPLVWGLKRSTIRIPADCHEWSGFDVAPSCCMSWPTSRGVTAWFSSSPGRRALSTGSTRSRGCRSSACTMNASRPATTWCFAAASKPTTMPSRFCKSPPASTPPRASPR